MKPYGIISDSHNHFWSAFSKVLPSGVNSRLRVLLDETKRCAAEVNKAGGDTLYHAGDLFHVRGSLTPSVLNPTLDCYREITESGIRVAIIPGNHDAEAKNVERVSSAVTSLEGVGCFVASGGNFLLRDGVVLVPWIENIDELKTQLIAARDSLSESELKECDAIIHAPIDGVIPGLPDHGLSPEWLGDLGFKRVFAGHYHNHKSFPKGVYSIGALAHHTWSDIGSKAGFLIVKDNNVQWFKSRAPEFIELNADDDSDELPLIVDGNYVRVKTTMTSAADIAGIRETLEGYGAAGVTVIAQKDASVVSRSDATVSAGSSVEASVSAFIKGASLDNPDKLLTRCMEILSAAKEAA